MSLRNASLQIPEAKIPKLSGTGDVHGGRQIFSRAPSLSPTTFLSGRCCPESSPFSPIEKSDFENVGVQSKKRKSRKRSPLTVRSDIDILVDELSDDKNREDDDNDDDDDDDDYDEGEQDAVTEDDVFFRNSPKGSSYLSVATCQYRNNVINSSSSSSILLPSLGTSPIAVCVNSPGRKKLQTFGLEKLKKIKQLGKGSFGTVLLGTLKGQRVAVKVIPKQSPCMSHSRRQKTIESELNAQLLNHENIVRIIGVYSNEEDNTVILMEYVGKSNLQRVLQENASALTEDFVHRCFTDLSSALAYCHKSGVLHLDVKPANVFVTSKGVCKLGDFGCSHLCGTVRSSSCGTPTSTPTSNTTESIAEGLVGTPGYQAPEFLMNEIPTAKCDVYSFGILMWQVCHKDTPYKDMHPHTILFKVASENYRPKDDDGTLSPALEPYRQIYRKCWETLSRRRPTMQEAHLEILSVAAAATSRRRKKSSSIRI